MENLITQSAALASQTIQMPMRFISEKIEWSWRLIGIRGPRGVGKTTLLLQRLKQQERAIYISLDDLHFATHRLRDMVEALHQRGFTHFFLDEVHKYADWAREIKNLYDFIPAIHIVFTGSSLIELRKLEVDLSRRAVLYDMPGLSFREYLLFTGVTDVKAISFDDLLHSHQEVALQWRREFRPLAHFDAYLQDGYYPYFLEGRSLYRVRLNQVIRLVLEVDLALAEGGRVTQVPKLARLLHFIAESVPFKPNIQNLATRLELDRNTVVRYLQHLRDARLLGLLYAENSNLSALQKPQKIYLDNPNLLFALRSTVPDAGTVRETFFYNQLSYAHGLDYPDAGDFRIDDRYVFEVGGHWKTRRQLPVGDDAYLALDNTEIGLERSIPLWMFGFLY